ncbi:hypothetical protein ACQP2U_19460 [Nocardia sp. CA-084685]|uniref:hypothetical protein n=1 Tax=Nocardia sp. CA-084685 TaxID=3239970 RepID=UPI003D99F973
MSSNDNWLTRITAITAPGTVVLSGAIFLFEGIPKFLRPETLGTGRFDKADIPAAAPRRPISEGGAERPPRFE